MELNTNQELKKIENEIISVKLLLMKILQKKKLESLHLEGSLGDIEVTEEDIEEAKKSLFRG